MPELRWSLFGLGALFIVGLALWEWRRSRRRHAQNAALTAIATGAQATSSEDWRRIEPRIDSMLGRTEAPLPELPEFDDVPVMHSTEPLSVPVARESAVDRPAAARMSSAFADANPMPAMDPAEPEVDDEPMAPMVAPPPMAAPAVRDPATIHWPPQRADRVVNLRVLLADGTLLAGREVRIALEQAGMVPGPQCIYHRVDDAGAVLASAADLLRPGDLDPLSIDQQQFRGLSVFSVLPGPLPPVRMLEELVASARAVAWRLGAVVQDGQGRELDGEALVRLRQSLPHAPGD